MFRSPSISGYIIFYMSIQDHTTSTTQDSKGRFVVYGNSSMLKYFKQNHCLYAKCSNALELCKQSIFSTDLLLCLTIIVHDNFNFSNFIADEIVTTVVKMD